MLYAIYVRDKADGLEERPSVRLVHLARLQLLYDKGRLLIAGPIPAVGSSNPGTAGFTGLTVIAEFESPRAVRAWTDADLHIAAGIYEYASVGPPKKAS